MKHNNSNAVLFSLLLVSILLSMTSSGSLLAEATIPNFSTIRENLVCSSSARRSLKPDPPADSRSPTRSPMKRQNAPESPSRLAQTRA
ncbi:hypothetical protein CXB51_017533 [Gossypium anomalum]|uniref:Uncharacterized protein n=1 Tax=Gossypium anomalum TaxID=47600 RepID=A0A8J5ZJ49_9ROSI|nr:hypothetical protein CXB51_017533 [Gossypium anomalum]